MVCAAPFSWAQESHDKNKDPQTGPHTELEINVDVALKGKPNAPIEVGEHRSEALDGQFALDIQMPETSCPKDEKLTRLIQACMKKEPSPIGNIVIDPGHFRGSTSDRSDSSGQANDNIHEGNLNMAVVLMTKQLLERCYDSGSRVKLLRHPWDTEFGQFHNEALAKSTLEKYEAPKGLRRNTIASLYAGDRYQRKAYARFLLGNGSDELEEKSSFWQIHANQSYSTMEFAHNGRTRKERRLTDHTLGLYYSKYSEATDRAATSQVVAPILDEMTQTHSVIRAALEAKVAEQAEGSLERARAQARLDYFNRDVTHQKDGGFSRSEGRPLGMVNRNDGHLNGSPIWKGLKSSVGIVEGLYMNGYVGKLASREVVENDARVRESTKAWKAAQESGDQEAIAKSASELKDVYQSSMVQVRERVYSAKEGKWVTRRRIGYHAPSPYVNYAKGLARGMVNGYKERCEKAGVNAG